MIDSIAAEDEMPPLAARPGPSLRTRAKAAGIHLAISALVAGVAAILVFRLWYPWPYAAISGGTALFTLIALVDVVMGPALTFVVFNPGKPRAELTRDLAVIALLQLGALVYGLHSIMLARPVALVLEVERFRVVRAVDVQSEDLPSTLPPIPWAGTIVLRAELPTDPNERFEAITMAAGGVDIALRPKYWRSWDQTARRQALDRALPVESLASRYPEQRADIVAAIERTGRPATRLRYLPVQARGAVWVALIDSESADVVGFAPIDAL